VSADPYEDTVVGRDPLTKTIAQGFIRDYPLESDEQIAERIQRAARSLGGPDAEVPMTPEIVARWRPEVTR